MEELFNYEPGFYIQFSLFAYKLFLFLFILLQLALPFLFVGGVFWGLFWLARKVFRSFRRVSARGSGSFQSDRARKPPKLPDEWND